MRRLRRRGWRLERIEKEIEFRALLLFQKAEPGPQENPEHERSRRLSSLAERCAAEPRIETWKGRAGKSRGFRICWRMHSVMLQSQGALTA